MPEQRGGSDIRWPEVLGELGKMEARIMAAVRDAAGAAHTTSDRLDGRLLEHGAQHARDRVDHTAAHQAEWDAHHREHAANEARTFSVVGVRIGVGALVLQLLAVMSAAVTIVIRH